MAEKHSKEYWFKAKKYGWGWGLPANRKGWIAFSLFIAIWLLGLAWLLSMSSPDEEITVQNYTIFGVMIIADILGLLYVSFKYGEAPKSLSGRWGDKKHATKSKSD